MRTKDEQKRIAIRDATIEEVITGGLASASIARIAKRAGLSQGTIYLYYANKEELIRQVYVELKLDLRDTLMACFHKEASSADNLRALWFALLSYSLDHPKRTAFTEYVTAANLLDGFDEPALRDVERELKSVITRAISDGTLSQAPYEAHLAILVAPITHLARRSTLAGKTVSKKTCQHTFDMIWRGITQK